MTTTQLIGSDLPVLSESYRSRWSWDEVRWASHCIDCYPGNCPMRVYVKDGKVVREESAASSRRMSRAYRT